MGEEGISIYLQGGISQGQNCALKKTFCTESENNICLMWKTMPVLIFLCPLNHRQSHYTRNNLIILFSVDKH